MNHDQHVLRELAKRYAAVAAQPCMDELRELWRSYCAKERTRPPVVLDIGLWQAWAKRMFPAASMECNDPSLKVHERSLRFLLLHAEMGDDTVFEPWYAIQAVHQPEANDAWGVSFQRDEVATGGVARAEESVGTAYHLHPVLVNEEDIDKLSKPSFVIDEEATKAVRDTLQEAFGDELPVHVDRGPFLKAFGADISTTIARLRGLEEMMIDMYERPQWLHRLAKLLQQGILEHHDACEAAGDISYAAGFNQGVPYHRDLPDPEPNRYAARRDELWAFFAAQEFTDVSPAMHEEFLLQYQRPIMEKWARVSYGCCENLTRKIDMLRGVKNLQRIAVTPFADLESCAEQIGTDYLLSWRPKPTDMVCNQFDARLSERRLREGVGVCKQQHNHFDIMLKDVEALAAGPESLKEWTAIARTISEE
jgi:hypothetical protein